MRWKNPSDEALRELLASSRTIAVVGCSPDPARVSHRVAAELKARGYQIVPVHPAGGKILGEPVYPDLLSIPPSMHIDIVDVFRRAEFCAPIAEQAVVRGARALWLQEGIVNAEAGAIAERGRCMVVMDLCISVMVRALFGPGWRVTGQREYAP